MNIVEILTNGFLVQVMAGMLMNLQIAAVALALGLVFGLPLAWAHLRGGYIGAASNLIVALMRASPTFVVMFVLLNMSPGDKGDGVKFAAVALSLAPYAAAYCADNGLEALRFWRADARADAFLFLPNLMRAFFVLVMASSSGAAVGLSEGIAIILRHAEPLSSLQDKLLLFGMGIACFGIPLQAGYILVGFVQRRLAFRQP